jgi:alpha-tubulin suppressor-like RCC1 family protein
MPIRNLKPLRSLLSSRCFWLFLLLAAGITPGGAAELRVAKISAGNSHTLAVDASGAVFGWGSNEFGQLGEGTMIARAKPVAVKGIGGAVSQVAAGDVHSVALLADGSVMTWGFNGYGQLGDNTTTLSLLPVQATTTSVSSDLPPVTRTVPLSGVTAISAGLSHTLALKNDGSLLSWGQNASGQLGLNSVLNAQQATAITALAGRSITAISSGHNHSLALRSDGAVYAWGVNESGQLGDGKTKNLLLPTQIAALTNIVALAAGAQHSLALRHDGTVWAWGANSAGQLGDATTTARGVPVQVSGLTGVAAIAANGEHSLALRNDGTVWAWGHNGVGQLGDGTTNNRSTPRLVGNLIGAVAIAAGTSHSAALRDNGQALAWGSNWQGQLGGGTRSGGFSPSPAPIALADPLLAAPSPLPGLSAGDSHTLAVDYWGGAYGWGGNEFGQVGDGTTAVKTIPAAISRLAQTSRQVAAGDVHSLALLADGTVSAWGFNGYGQLGDNSTTLSLTPVPTTTTSVSTTIPPVTTTIPLSGVIAIAAGLNHSLALKSDGSLLAWGQNAAGQLGSNSLIDAKQATALATLAGRPITAITAGPNHSLALRHDGAVYAWGANESGQLGDGKTKNLLLPTPVTTLTRNIVALAAGAKHSLALRNDGTVWAWGANNAGQLGDASTVARLVPVQVSGLTGVTAIAASGEHSLALRNDGTVWAWGNNLVGQLGDCTTANRSTPRLVANLVGVMAIAAGTAHSAAIRDNGNVLSWGGNWYGQLGDGTIINRSCPVLASGLVLSSAPVVEYYHSGLDHYFITADATEAAGLDTNPSLGWLRTGNTFKSAGNTAVCRFYGSQSPGPNSHFYTVSATECAYLRELQASTPATQKRWNFESYDFYSTPPLAGACPAGTLPVYRAYNNGFARNIDSNHRITASESALQEVLARGWSNEGAVMCAPL